MNNRIKKKAEKRRRADLHKILDLVLEINGLERRSQEYTGNLPTAFFEFSGHTGGLSIRLYPEGWKPGPKGIRYEIYTDRLMSGCGTHTVQDVIRQLEKFQKEKDPGSCNSQSQVHEV